MQYQRELGSTGKGAAYVLLWLPSYLDRDGGGCWRLQPAREYKAGRPARGPQNQTANRDAAPGDLAEWAAGQLGYPVALEPACAFIRPASPDGECRAEPLYYLRRDTAAGKKAPRARGAGRLSASSGQVP